MYPQFIHNKGKQNYGPFVVEVLNYQQYPAMTSHMVKIQKRVGFGFSDFQCFFAIDIFIISRPSFLSYLSFYLVNRVIFW